MRARVDGRCVTGPGGIGRFRILADLGAGRYGRVWKVADPLRLNQPFALKVLHRPRRGGGRGGGFNAELTAGVEIRHAALVEVYEAGIVDHEGQSQPYLLLEFVEGRALLPRWRPASLVPLALELLSALDAIHRAGWCHGDLHPANVLVTTQPDADVRLLDFGLAYRPDQQQAPAIGTPRFAAPELLYGANVSPASDLYSLAMILLEALAVLPHAETGERLLATRQGTFYRQVSDLDWGSSQMAESWGLFFRRLLDPDPACRAQTAEEAATILSAREWEGSRPRRRAPPRFEVARLERTDAASEYLRDMPELLKSLPRRPALCILRGPPGAGKTRWLRDAQLCAAASGVRSVRFEFARAVFESRAETGAERSAQDLFYLSESGAGAQGTPRLQVAAAVATEMLNSLAAVPTLLVIDDFDRLGRNDQLIVELLIERMRIQADAHRPQAPRLAVCLAMDSRAARANDFAVWWNRLDRLAWVAQLELEPWPEADVARYLDRALAPAHTTGILGAQLCRCAGGNPGRVRQTLEELYRHGELRMERGEWRWESRKPGEFPPLPSAADDFGSAWSDLSAGAQDILLVAALWGELGRSLDGTILCEILAVDPATVSAHLRAIRAADVLDSATLRLPDGAVGTFWAAAETSNTAVSAGGGDSLSAICVDLRRLERVRILRRAGATRRQRLRRAIAGTATPTPTLEIEWQRLRIRVPLQVGGCDARLDGRLAHGGAAGASQVEAWITMADAASQRGDRFLHRLLAYSAQQLPQAHLSRARIAHALGSRLHALGLYRKARSVLVQCVQACDAAAKDDPSANVVTEAAQATIELAEGAVLLGDLDAAGEYLDSLAVEPGAAAGSAGDRDGARVEYCRGLLAYRCGNFDSAFLIACRGLERYQGDLRLMNLRANAAMACGDLTGAATTLAAAVAAPVKQESAAWAATLANYARCLTRTGRADESVAVHRRAVKVLQKAGRSLFAAKVRANLGVTLRRRGCYEECETCFRQSLRALREAGERLGTATLEANLGILAVELGLYGTATRHFAAAEQVVETHSIDGAAVIGQPVCVESRAIAAFELGQESTLQALLARRGGIGDGRDTSDALTETLRLELRLWRGGYDDGSVLLNMASTQTIREQDCIFWAELAWFSAAANALVPGKRSAVDQRLVSLGRGRAVEALQSLGATSDRARFFYDIMTAAKDPLVLKAEGAAADLGQRAAATPLRLVRVQAFTMLARHAPRADDRSRARTRLRGVLDEIVFDCPVEARSFLRDRADFKEALAVTAEPDISSQRGQEAREILRHVFQLNREVLKESRLESLLRKIVDVAAELTNAERGFLVMRRRGRLRILAARSHGKSIDDPESQMSRTLVDRTLADGSSRLATDARADVSLRSIASVEELGLQSVICVPLVAKRARVLGALYLDNPFERGVFTAEDLELAESFSAQAALAWAAAQRRQQTAGLLRELRGVNKRLEYQVRTARRALVHSARSEHSRRVGIVGQSAAHSRVMQLAEAVAPTSITVLVTGESGTGKELIARQIHALSERSARPFVAENCAALPETLLESALFGHVRGAFTGAESDAPGLFAMAEGGTLFLDEVGELSPPLQSRLLRVLQEREVRPLGAREAKPIDVRVIAATRRNIHQEIASGGFREDLYYRLQGAEIHVPPLRERPEDIPVLVEHLLAKEAKGASTKSVSVETMDRLCAYSWPGNVRELENEVRRLSLLCPMPVIEAEYLSPHVREGRTGFPSNASDAEREVRPLRLVEREAILHALSQFDGHRGRVANALGISRSTLYVKLKEIGYDGT